MSLNHLMVRMQITVQSLLCHDNVDVVLVKNPTKLLKECFMGGNVAHLIVRILGGGGNNNCFIDDFPTFGCALFGCSLSRAAFTAPVTREI